MRPTQEVIMIHTRWGEAEGEGQITYVCGVHVPSITDVYMRVTCRLSYNFSTVSGFQMAYYYYDLMALDTFLLIPFHHVVWDCCGPNFSLYPSSVVSTATRSIASYKFKFIWSRFRVWTIKLAQCYLNMI